MNLQLEQLRLEKERKEKEKKGKERLMYVFGLVRKKAIYFTLRVACYNLVMWLYDLE